MAAKNNEENKSDGNNFQISGYVHEIHDLVTRIDERVKTIFKLQNESDKKLEKLRDNNIIINSKINSIENFNLPNLDKKFDCLKKELESLENDLNNLLSKTQKFESETKDLRNFKRSTEERAKFIFDIIFKLLMTLAGAYIIYHLGWNK